MVTMKKVITLIIFIIGGAIMNAQDVKVISSGQGTTEDEATKIALRSALEDTFGTFISSSTNIENDVLISDEIVSLSQGNIKEYKKISSSQLANGLYSITVDAIVSLKKLASYCESKGMSVDFNGKVFAMEIKLKEFERQNEIKALKNLCLQIFSMNPKVYDYQLATSEPVMSSKKDTVFITIGVGRHWNSNYYNIEKHLRRSIYTIALSRSQVKNLKKLGISTTDAQWGEHIYCFRDEKAINVVRKFWNAYQELIPNSFVIDGFKNEYDVSKYTKLWSYTDNYYRQCRGETKIKTTLWQKMDYHWKTFSLYYSIDEIKKLDNFQLEPFNQEKYETIIKPKLLEIIAEFDNIK